MKIDHSDPGASPRDGEWCVHVAVSVLQNVPADVVRAWMACESFQRGNAEFWPDNRALCIRMGVKAVTSAQRLLLRLEQLGILERQLSEGNHRTLRLRRRISQPITPGEWAEMELRAEGCTHNLSGHPTSIRR